MRVKKSLVLLLTFSIMIAIFTGCSDKKGSLDGKWAYIHDKEAAALTIDNGKAVLDGTGYKCSYDDSFITLTNSDTETRKLRYLIAEDYLVLYKQTDYTYTGEGAPTGIVGLWEDTADNWSYEFTEEGNFVEDGFFSGTYKENPSEQTITLDYNEDFQDTVIYYSISGDQITIEYPWKMVKIK